MMFAFISGGGRAVALGWAGRCPHCTAGASAPHGGCVVAARRAASSAAAGGVYAGLGGGVRITPPGHSRRAGAAWWQLAGLLHRRQQVGHSGGLGGHRRESSGGGTFVLASPGASCGTFTSGMKVAGASASRGDIHIRQGQMGKQRGSGSKAAADCALVRMAREQARRVRIAWARKTGGAAAGLGRKLSGRPVYPRPHCADGRRGRCHRSHGTRAGAQGSHRTGEGRVRNWQRSSGAEAEAVREAGAFTLASRGGVQGVFPSCVRGCGSNGGTFGVIARRSAPSHAHSHRWGLRALVQRGEPRCGRGVYVCFALY